MVGYFDLLGAESFLTTHFVNVVMMLNVIKKNPTGMKERCGIWLKNAMCKKKKLNQNVLIDLIFFIFGMIRNSTRFEL